MSDEIIDTGIMGIKVRVCDPHEETGGYNAAELVESDLQTDSNDDRYNAAMNAVESIIVAHAFAGIDITTPAYKEGIETAIDSICNQYGD